MDIQLRSSRYLLIFRLCLLAVAFAAIIMSVPGSFWTILLCTAACLEFKALVFINDPVCGISMSREHDTTAVAAQQKIIVELKSNRRIEFTVRYFYCLWWLQILYLSSSRRSVVIIVLPDSCSADERRCLRQYLNQYY